MYSPRRKEKAYVAIHAQRLREQRAAESHAWHLLAHEPLEALEAYVRLKLGEGWSLEQIAGRLPREYPEDSRMCISHETIYGYIYALSKKKIGSGSIFPGSKRNDERRPAEKFTKADYQIESASESALRLRTPVPILGTLKAISLKANAQKAMVSIPKLRERVASFLPKKYLV